MIRFTDATAHWQALLWTELSTLCSALDIHSAGPGQAALSPCLHCTVVAGQACLGETPFALHLYATTLTIKSVYYFVKGTNMEWEFLECGSLQGTRYLLLPVNFSL